jgi:hypothetical protein
MALVLVLVWFGLLVQVCWSVLLSSVGNNSCPLWATTLVLCGQQLLSSVSNNSCPLWATTLVLCGQQHLSSVGNNPCPLWATTLVLCGTATLVLCGTAVVLCGTHHPLWLPFRLIGWFGLLVRFWDESLWFLVKVARQPFGSCGLRGNPQSRPTLMN